MDMEFPLPPRLVHRVLLTDPSELETLAPGLKSRTPSFSEFQEKLLQDSTNPAHVMKRAYLQNIQKEIEDTIQPLHNLLLELHKAIRALVPNRPDLHSFLQDEIDLPEPDNAAKLFLPHIVKAAQALSRLESEARSQSTINWIQMATMTTTTTNNKSLEFMIASIFYLIDKAELCSQDKQDFYLTEVLAPRIRNTKEGLVMERKTFHSQFEGKMPISRKWVQGLVDSYANQEDLTSKKHRRDLIKRGWIDDILFQREKQVELPEVFFMDLPHLQAIRNTTRIAAAGCALGYFACIATKVDPEVLLQDGSKGEALVQVLNHKFHASIEAYEQSVEDCVVSLAKEWSESTAIETPALETLKNQSRSVLKGESPVIKLLDNRMRDIVSNLVIHEFEKDIPKTLQAGVKRVESAKPRESVLVTKAKKVFQERGLAFYATELALATELAAKVANLACDLYMEEILDPMILESLT